MLDAQVRKDLKTCLSKLTVEYYL